MFSIYTVVSFQSNEHGSVVPKGTALRGIPIRRCKTTGTSFAKEILAEQRGFYKASQCAVYPSDDPTPPNPYSPEIAGTVVPTRPIFAIRAYHLRKANLQANLAGPAPG